MVASSTILLKMTPLFHRIAKFYWATNELVQKAIDVAVAARPAWERVPLSEKFDIWLKVGN